MQKKELVTIKENRLGFFSLFVFVLCDLSWSAGSEARGSWTSDDYSFADREAESVGDYSNRPTMALSTTTYKSTFS